MRLPIQIKKKEVLSISTSGNDLNKKDAEGNNRQKEKKTSLEMSFSPSVTATELKEEEIRRVKIEFEADEEVAKLIERARDVLRHKYPKGRFEDLVKEAFKLLLEKKDPLHRHPEPEASSRRGRRIQSKSGSLGALRLGMTEKSGMTKKVISRYIPQEIKQKVWKRDNGKCTFQSKEGRRCNEQGMLEIDHVQPFALDGKNEIENLRLLCAVHNKWRSQVTFGKMYEKRIPL